jgi:hypothetical protein
MVLDREANGYSGNYNQNRNSTSFRSSTPRGFGGRNAYQFSDMQAENHEIENRVSVEEALKRVSGQPVDRNETPVQVEPRGQTSARQPPEETGGAEEGSHIQWIFQNGTWVPVVVESPVTTGGTPSTGEAPAMGGSPEKEQLPVTKVTQEEQIQWEIQNGTWVPVRKSVPQENIPETTIEKGTTKINQEFPWVEQVSEPRVIQIPVDKLIAGESRYNIIIKAGDTIVVPLDVAGKIYVMGNVNRTGEMDLTGGRMTLKQVIAAAGSLGPLAWPKRCEITRRIGRNKEEIVRVDLDKIFSGEQPDIYIKPHDIINVGTHAVSRWLALLRNSFRATYGFGFVYDRNFADKDFYSSRLF